MQKMHTEMASGNFLDLIRRLYAFETQHENLLTLVG